MDFYNLQGSVANCLRDVKMISKAISLFFVVFLVHVNYQMKSVHNMATGIRGESNPDTDVAQKSLFKVVLALLSNIVGKE